MKFNERLKHAWNAFANKNDTTLTTTIGYGSGLNASRSITRSWTDRTFAATVFNRISLDASMVDILHVKVDEKSGNQTKKDSGLQKCLAEEANIDQTGMQFIHDLVYSMLDEGVVAVVPVDTTTSLLNQDSFGIQSMRVGKITQWYPEYVRINLYNEDTGRNEDLTLPKKNVAIIENPLYSVINGDTGPLKRLIRKMSLLDQNEEDVAGGNFNMIVQLPYVVKGEIRQKQAEERIKNIETQLTKGRYGIAYIDGTEKVTQLNKSLAPNLHDEVKYLTEQFYNALGLTQNVFNGTASESEMRGYYNRTIDPIIKAITLEFTRKFLSKTARSQGQKLVAYRDPFELVPVEQLATIADTFSRNAILTPNEIRKIVGYGPNSDPESDKLSNRNIADVNQDTAGVSTSVGSPDDMGQ